MRAFIQFFVFGAGILSAQSLAKLPAKVEYVHAFSPEGQSINYADIVKQVGRVALTGDIYGLHHGTIGAVSATVPFNLKGVTLAPGAVAIFGRYETGPGFVTRWEYCKGIFCTEGTMGFYHPVKDGKGLQFLGDPVNADIRLFKKLGPTMLRNTRLGYPGEYGRYGKFGLETDKLHNIEAKTPIDSGRTHVLFAYVPGYKTWKIGISRTFHSEDPKH